MHSIWRKPTNDMIVSRVVQDGATIYTIGFFESVPHGPIFHIACHSFVLFEEQSSLHKTKNDNRI